MKNIKPIPSHSSLPSEVPDSQSSLMRFTVCLLVVAFSYLLIAGILKFSSFTVYSIEGFLAVDGAFDGPASAAVQTMGAGLPVAAMIIIALAALWWFLERSSWSPFRLKESTFLSLLVVVKLAICIIFIHSFPYQPWDLKPLGDDGWYYKIAVQLSQGIDPSVEGQPTALWPIGYPLLLAIFFKLFGTGYIVAQWVNSFILVGITVLTYYVGKSLFGLALAQRAAVVILLMPSQIIHALPIMSDILQAFLALGMIYLAAQPLKVWRTILLGVVFGFAVLAKPVVIFSPLGLAVYWRLRGTSWRITVQSFILVMAVGVLVLVPWQIRNQRVFGRFVFVAAVGGQNLWQGNNPNANGGILLPQFFVPDSIARQMEPLNEAERDAIMYQHGMAWIKANPVKSVMLWYKKIIILFYEDSKCVSRSFMLSHTAVDPAAISIMFFLTEGYYYSLGLAFLIGAFQFLRRERWSSRIWLIFGTILYFIIIYLPYTTEGRYHTVMLPLFAIIAVWFVQRATSQQKPIA